MPEEILHFGKELGLTGIACEPATTTRQKQPGLVFCPGDTLHHGPGGIHIALARALEPLAITTLRFDSAGRGDSLGRFTAGAAPSEIRSALAAMSESFGCDRFILFGAGEAAQYALACAADDGRVGGVIIAGGFRRSPGDIVAAIRRCCDFRACFAALCRRMIRTASKQSDAAPSAKEAFTAGSLEKLRARINNRELALLVLELESTSIDPANRIEFPAALKKRASVVRIAGADGDFSFEISRAEVCGAVTTWVSSLTFPASSGHTD